MESTATNTISKKEYDELLEKYETLQDINKKLNEDCANLHRNYQYEISYLKSRLINNSENKILIESKCVTYKRKDYKIDWIYLSKFTIDEILNILKCKENDKMTIFDLIFSLFKEICHTYDDQIVWSYDVQTSSIDLLPNTLQTHLDRLNYLTNVNNELIKQVDDLKLDKMKVQCNLDYIHNFLLKRKVNIFTYYKTIKNIRKGLNE